MLQSLNALAGKISPSSPTDSNANKVHMHNNNNVVHHHHPYSKQQAQPSPASHSSNNSDQKENTNVFIVIYDNRRFVLKTGTKLVTIAK
ncbi:hypothetical protein KPH14_009122 [Odynerus spinipes]|uniref:Uncharacterized protein n=1 Tax=Odynerus spinipes TaxID=1348599 RepID=A0AAD9RNM8_9HYME|nr:hypothetical protein KPH14_009122 [Odynerus spinipes]